MYSLRVILEARLGLNPYVKQGLNGARAKTLTKELLKKWFNEQASLCQVCGLSGDKLLLKTRNSALAQELTWRQGELIAWLNQKLNARVVKNIVIRAS